MKRVWPLVLLGLFTVGTGAVKADTVSFSKQILPLLKAQCFSCHANATPASGYALFNRDQLLAGGRHGAAIVAGKSASGTFVKYLTGELKPKMPPGGAIDLETISIIRKWIDEGARVDSMLAPPPTKTANSTPGGNIRSISTLARLPAPVTALAFMPDNKTVIVGGFRSLRFMNADDGMVLSTTIGISDQVLSISVSPDGKSIAAASGKSGFAGEVVLVDAATRSITGKLIGHDEVVTSVAWKPDGTEIATSSLDKTVRIWDATTLKQKRLIKDHVDAVYSVAYSHDGRFFASGSGDRTAKVYDAKDYSRMTTLSVHQDGISTVAFGAKGETLWTLSLDKSARIWPVKKGTIENPLRSQYEGDQINVGSISADGSLFIWGSANHNIKVFKGDGTNQLRELKEVVDWVSAVAIAPDNKHVAAGGQDGSVHIWDTKDWKHMVSVTMPTGSVAAKVVK